MSSANFPSLSPIESFAAVSGLSPVQLKGLLTIVLIVVLLLSYMWASRHGYNSMVNDGEPWSFLKLLLWGAALILCVVSFFVY